jgi:hypothetical protein
MTSGGGAAAIWASSAAPLSGLPEGMRSSKRRRSANKDISCAACLSSSQAKERSTANTTRSMKPALRAAARTASAASPAASGSSPEIK